MSKKLLLLNICLAMAFVSGAQADEGTGSIRGYVRDASSGETLPNANVSVDDGTRGATTDKAGPTPGRRRCRGGPRDLRCAGTAAAATWMVWAALGLPGGM